MWIARVFGCFVILGLCFAGLRIGWFGLWFCGLVGCSFCLCAGSLQMCGVLIWWFRVLRFATFSFSCAFADSGCVAVVYRFLVCVLDIWFFCFLVVCWF